MYKFSKRSKERLSQCHPDLQEIMNEVIKIMDITVLTGHRDKAQQNEAYANGNSQLQYPNSKHNNTPSLAVDTAPYPLDWENINKFERMCGIIEGIAHMKGIKVRMGRDFSFKDYVHTELVIDE